MNWLDLALLVLASFRLTHLIVFDSIMEPVRQRLVRVRYAAELISCYWCCGVWVSGALVAGYLLWPSGARIVLAVLAVAGGQALLESLVQRE